MLSRRTSRAVALLLSMTAYACISSSSQPAQSAQTETSGALLRTASVAPVSVADATLAAQLQAIVRDVGGTASAGRGYLVLRFRNAALFQTGKVDLSGSGIVLLQRLAPVILAVQAGDVDRPTTYTSSPLLVTGLPVDWPLSQLRAEVVSQFFDDLDLPALTSSTARESVPMASEAEDARAALPSRRVDVKVPASQQFQAAYFRGNGT